MKPPPLILALIATAIAFLVIRGWGNRDEPLTVNQSAEFAQPVLSTSAASAGNASAAPPPYILDVVETAEPDSRVNPAPQPTAPSPDAPPAGIAQDLDLAATAEAVELKQTEQDEERATARLHMARNLMRKKNIDAARIWLQGVVEEFPRTTAAKKAAIDLGDLRDLK